MNQVEDNTDHIPVLEGISPDQPHQADSIDSRDALEIPQAQITPVPTVDLHARQRSSRPDSCFHSVIDRQYCVDDFEQCNVCGRVPFLNWFYRCIVDTSAFTEPFNPDRPILSPWMAKAALDGHYTDEELNVLFRQKLEVLEMAEKLRQTRSSPHATEVDQERPDDDDDDDRQVWVEDVNQDSSRSSPSTRTRVHAIPRPPCTHHACHHCNPALHQRCWLSIDAICTDPEIKPFTEWDFHERPMSDTRIVRTLGMRSTVTHSASPSIYSLSESDHFPGTARPHPRHTPIVRLPRAVRSNADAESSERTAPETRDPESSIDATSAFVRGDFASSSIAEAVESSTPSTAGPTGAAPVETPGQPVDVFSAVRELLAVAEWEHGGDADSDASHHS
ncbi:uncharacterized protein BDW47DRAFT_107722 [Aspergillus candidus]|uniref:Uncharacterized protein n=1 Tax=Aspergillus candidus TaxID=41067 RepID=A0A2I2F8T6_ASPCN|nr:hypothetical protein BDW47DRAFT_107722 [Aspergillus candidus]PLB37040.1 hypothetical protein BDW47DRAFT_107722 [Aspergillus candidus]